MISTGNSHEWLKLIWLAILKAIGLAMTALAITLGAPTWFQILQKFVDIRSTDKKPDPAK